MFFKKGRFSALLLNFCHKKQVAQTPRNSGTPFKIMKSILPPDSEWSETFEALIPALLEVYAYLPFTGVSV
jgi:hypothetical protein